MRYIWFHHNITTFVSSLAIVHVSFVFLIGSFENLRLVVRVIKTVCDIHKRRLITIGMILIHSHTLKLRKIVARSFSSIDRILIGRHCALWILINSSEIVWWHWTHVCIATMLVIRCIEWRERPLIYSIYCSVKQFIYSWFKECSIHIA